MQTIKRLLLNTALLLFFATNLLAQQRERTPFFNTPDTLDKVRLWGLSGGILGSYGLTVVGLNQAWYADYPRSRFHFFNDWAEWKDMDKSGHLFTAYFQSKWTTSMYDWTGVPHKKSIWIGAGASAFFQGTIEIMDAFSDNWGFSWGDIGFNTTGAMVYLGQELAWEEQRIVLKYSAHIPKYQDVTITAVNNPEATTTIKERGQALYGKSIPEIALKDYNAFTIWASGNIHSFIKKENTRFPKWLNVAVGYGAENLYAGYGYGWEDEEGNVFVLDEADFPRYRQFFLSMDVDFTRIKTKSKPLKTFFGILNIIKVPFPALELNTIGKPKFHAIYF